jgi:hypothetical protein
MHTFKIVLYLLAIFTCLACTIFLFRHYLRQRLRLLLWSALCFVGLTINNILLFVDLVMFPAVDMRPIRLLAALIGLSLLLYGFIWEAE